MRSLRQWFRGGRKTRPSRRGGVRPALEPLETRVVLYSASGDAWPNPQIVTISFIPDGTNLGGATSNLFSAFNSNPNLVNRWQNQIIQAAQVWAQQTNVNFEVVPDDGEPAGAGPDQQGDPGFGDIRIGGCNFNSSTLALTSMPPPANNYSIAGDITFNTGQAFNIGSTYDLFTVAMHEFGHALGLGESSVANAVEYPMYTGLKRGLAADDIAGIQSIYGGARKPDAYNSAGASNATLAAAAPINSLINAGTLTGLVPNLDITAAGQQEYFSFTAPAGTGGTLELDAQSYGLSLLAPKLTVYAANGTTVLASANGAGQYGTTLTVSVPNVTANEQFYVEVQGADTTQMGTGRYALGLSFNGTAPPTEASPTVVVPDGNPVHSGGGEAYEVATPSPTPTPGTGNNGGIPVQVNSSVSTGTVLTSIGVVPTDSSGNQSSLPAQSKSSSTVTAGASTS